jgi:hypothetical protein
MKKLPVARSCLPSPRHRYCGTGVRLPGLAGLARQPGCGGGYDSSRTSTGKPVMARQVHRRIQGRDLCSPAPLIWRPLADPDAMPAICRLVAAWAAANNYRLPAIRRCGKSSMASCAT